MFKYSHILKGLLFVFVAVFLFVSVTLVRNPYIAVALSEGFPAAVWPSKGAFAELGKLTSPTKFDLSRSNTGNIQNGTKSTGSKSTGSKQLEHLFKNSQGSALLVVRDGAIELELFSAGFNDTTKFNSYSLVKSLVGALVFKAVADKKIQSLDAQLGTIFIEFENSPIGSTSLRSLLNMTSKIQFEATGSKALSVREPKDLQQSFANPFGPMVELHFHGLHKVLEHLVVAKDLDKKFNYQNINTALLALVIEKAYGQPINKVLEDHIWNPAGAGVAHWRKYGSSRRVTAYCCLYATTRDWARVAMFLMSNGAKGRPFLPQNLWDDFFGKALKDKQVLSGAYANHTRYDILNRNGHALQGRFVYFMGHNGQVVYLMPQEKLVVVRFGEKPQLLHSTLYEVWNSINPK